MADHHGAYRALGKVGFVVETIGPCEIAVFTGGKRALLIGAVLQGKIALKANLFQKGENICMAVKSSMDTLWPSLKAKVLAA